MILDDVGTADLAAVPHPSIDAIAARGVTFTTCVTSPLCSPSRHGILFGSWAAHPVSSGCAGRRPQDPDAAEVSLAELVAPIPMGLFGKWHLGGNPLGGTSWWLGPPVQGFATWRAGTHSNVQECGGRHYSNWTRIDDALVSERERSYEPTEVNAEAIAWLTTQRGPKLTIVSHQLAHSPFHVPPAELNPDGWFPDTTSNLRAAYELMIVAADTLIGELDARLGPDDWIFIVGDNGTPMQVAPDETRAKRTTFERGIRVPLIVAGPAANKGSTCDALVHAVDIYATIAEILGKKGRPGMDSVSLAPLLICKVATPPHEYVLCGIGQDATGGDVCARSARYKLRQLDDDLDGVTDREEFYDLWKDPEELVDLIASSAHAKFVKAHRAFLAEELP